MNDSEKEPVFARQEQAVVYLFSRYWDKIKHFEGKRICDIQTHFPDCSLDEWQEAIEFEYCLSSFYAHVTPEKYCHKSKSLTMLEEEGYRVLYIVYWEQDTDKETLRDKIKVRGFTGKIVFVCLHEYFSPLVEKEADCLNASWMFSPTRSKDINKVYSLKDIREETRQLASHGLIQPLGVNKGLYRVAGFNMVNAAFVECDHWKRIHFYSTSGFAKDKIPSRLFVKPTGCGRFSGCFEVKDAFTVCNDGKLLEDYFRRYYFYTYDQSRHDGLCIVYSDFTELNYEQGTRLYDYLANEKYALKQASEVIDKKHMRQIDKIVG